MPSPIIRITSLPFKSSRRRHSIVIRSATKDGGIDIGTGWQNTSAIASELGGGYLFGLPIGFIADSIGATLGATAAFLLGRTGTFPLSLSARSTRRRPSPLEKKRFRRLASGRRRENSAEEKGALARLENSRDRKALAEEEGTLVRKRKALLEISAERDGAVMGMTKEKVETDNEVGMELGGERRAVCGYGWKAICDFQVEELSQISSSCYCNSEIWIQDSIVIRSATKDGGIDIGTGWQITSAIASELGGGYLFGLPIGFIADSIGATLGATAAFLLGRTIGRPYVISKLKNYPKFQAVAIAIQRSGFKVPNYNSCNIPLATC
ncbi:hypothetical protein ZIOFF_056967 [Zingiber officinale]|uniref:Uncharacterized protein n=1 Tax=Zingiber officinale TaxID=94328 RepID=A0A8J5KLC5_ZINOF|nr:hypothetical protein ZIOFF_056967 [Zingiber officinale]